MDFLIISGMSGAGKSEAVRILEDMGYYCMDNVPPILLSQIVGLMNDAKFSVQKVAFVADIRGRGFFESFFDGLDSLREMNINPKILFMDAQDFVLINRYKELRRPHPLSEGGLIQNGIDKERKLLSKIRKQADFLVDTSHLKKADLKAELSKLFLEEKISNLTINVCSFGFKYGTLTDADLVFDVRFIPNPFYISELKALSGEDEPVKKFVLENELTKIFLEKITELLAFLIPHYTKEGKSSLVIGVGCTGGRHRSVAIASELCKRLEKTGERAVVTHRDIMKEAICL